MAKFKLPIRVWILIFFVLFAVFAIKPSPYATGVQVKTVELGSDVAVAGLAKGQIVFAVNDDPIATVLDFTKAMEKLEVEPEEITVVTYKERILINYTEEVNETVEEEIEEVVEEVEEVIEEDVNETVEEESNETIEFTGEDINETVNETAEEVNETVEIIENVNETLEEVIEEEINELIEEEIEVVKKPKYKYLGREEFTFNATTDIGFTVDDNMTIISVTSAPVQIDSFVTSINDVDLENLTDFSNAVADILPKQVVKIDTDAGQIAFLIRGSPRVLVGEAAKSNIKKGLDLEGGTRVLLKPVAEDREITEKDIGDIIQVLSNRLNVYGLSDVKIRSSVDWSGEAYILVEIAGASKEEVKDLIAQQGHFEARIANETVFVGGKDDIPFVCRDDGSCSGVRSCWEMGGGQHACKFEFVIHVSPDAAKRHANVTSYLDIVPADDGREILSENIDFFLDDKLVDSLQIGADLKGSETTAIAISGSGVASDRNAAIDASVNNMNKLQTILITGSLPFDLEIAKLDSISPLLGKHFVKNSLLVGLFAMLAVALIIFIRYRSAKVLIPMVLTSGSELLIILGFAALIQWNLDMAAIAGIIAAIGTGVDDQIVILDEVVSGKERHMNWKTRIKRAFFIIFAAYSTTVAAMVPLWNAGAGLIRGFAITIIVGVSIGVFLTRPAFAAIIEKMFKD